MAVNSWKGGRRGFKAPAATAALVILLIALIGGIGQVFATEKDLTPDDDDKAEAMDTPSSAATESTTRSAAVDLDIPAIGVDSRLVRLDAAADKTMELPPADGAGWYTLGVAPGQAGVTIIAGYIRRSADQPGVFSRLRGLAAGDEITVTRADGKRATYQVTTITPYAQGDFPAEQFYASNGDPVLRIVTTGGKLRKDTPQGNVVVDAVLMDVR